MNAGGSSPSREPIHSRADGEGIPAPPPAGQARKGRPHVPPAWLLACDACGKRLNGKGKWTLRYRNSRRPICSACLEALYALVPGARAIVVEPGDWTWIAHRSLWDNSILPPVDVRRPTDARRPV